jgi:hypothetical protein
LTDSNLGYSEVQVFFRPIFAPGAFLMNQETSGVVFAPTRHLPSPLIAARAAAMHRLNCLDLDMTARRTLFGILTFVAINNLKRAIFPRRETLRQEAMLGSEGTLYRGLSRLEEKGYITREQVRQTRTGKFYLSPILLTDKAVLLLGLNELIHNHRSLKMKDGHIKERTKEHQSLQKSSSSEGSASTIDPETKLPTEVVPLLQLGVRKSAICMLMAEAKANGKRLGVVMKAVWHNIYRLRDREVVAYLSYLLKQDRDFSTKANELDAEQLATTQRQRYQNTLNSLDSRYNGWQVVTGSGQIVGTFIFSEGAYSRVERREGGRLSTLPVNLSFAMRFSEGELRMKRPN